MVNRLNELQISDTAIVEEAELNSAGLSGSPFSPSLNVLSTNATLKKITLASGIDLSEPQVAQGDLISLISGNATGVYTIDSIDVDEPSIIVVEDILSGTTTVANIFFNDGASITGFDPSNTQYSSTTTTVRKALLESLLIAEGKPRAPFTFWDWNSNPIWLYGIGQTRSNVAPYPMASDAELRELACSGKQNNTNANALMALYKLPVGIIRDPVQGEVASVTSQSVTYKESDFPHAGSSRVTVVLQDNGPSLPISFSENVDTRIVYIQLETNSSGNVTSNGKEIRNAFRLNTTITLLWAIQSKSNSNLNPETIVCAGGDVGEAIGAVNMRAQGTGQQTGYKTALEPGSSLVGRVHEQDRGSFSPTTLVAYISFV